MAKRIWCGVYTKWDSFIPRKYKINLILTLTYRWFRVCSSPSLLLTAIKDLRKLPLQNGYPQGVITFNINDVLNKNKNKPDNPDLATDSEKDILIVLPYLGLLSHQVTNVWNPVLTISTLSSISRSYSKAHAASNLFFHTKIAWTDLRGIRSSIKVAAGTVMNSTLANQNEDSMTEKQNTSKPSWKVTIHQPLLIM